MNFSPGGDRNEFRSTGVTGMNFSPGGDRNEFRSTRATKIYFSLRGDRKDEDENYSEYVWNVMHLRLHGRDGFQPIRSQAECC
jgi:hypothetical protein